MTIRVKMPQDTNEQVVFAKRSMEEAWPGFDASTFRRDLEMANAALEAIEELERMHHRNDVLVNVVIVLGGVMVLILMVSGYL